MINCVLYLYFASVPLHITGNNIGGIAVFRKPTVHVFLSAIITIIEHVDHDYCFFRTINSYFPAASEIQMCIILKVTSFWYCLQDEAAKQQLYYIHWQDYCLKGQDTLILKIYTTIHLSING